MLLKQFDYLLSSSRDPTITIPTRLHNFKFPTLRSSISVFRSPTPTRRLSTVRASLITNSDSFEVGRLIGSYGFMNVTSYSGFQSGEDVEYSSGDLGQLRVQDVGEGSVKIRLYEGRVSQGSRKGTSIIFKFISLGVDLVWATGFMFLIYWHEYWQELIETLAWAHERTPLANLIRCRDKPVALSIVQARLVGLAHFSVYPGKRAGGLEADMMAANELNAHAFLQSSSKGICTNLVLLVGGFETNTGEQWLAFRDDGKYSAADYGKIMSERISKSIEQVSWNRFEQEQLIKRRRYFVVRMFQGIMRGLVYMHDHGRLHQSLGPSSIVLNTIVERDAAYLIPQLRDLAFSVDVRYPFPEEGHGQLAEGLWRRATAAGAYTPMEKKAFGIADDIYGAGLLFAYLAFVPFCEAGVVDSLSLQRLLESTFRLDLEATREYCLADDRFVEAVKFLDLNDRAGWQLLQAMLNPDFRQRPLAEAVLNHRFMTTAII